MDKAFNSASPLPSYIGRDIQASRFLNLPPHRLARLLEARVCITGASNIQQVASNEGICEGFSGARVDGQGDFEKQQCLLTIRCGS
ncbi:unnamed protein product [Linum trigynum]|uniref:Uncharacterized protein n=1 Tax=Linum trigynum TaxID=586398 RepID=A0AAV2GLF2_9ROSI